MIFFVFFYYQIKNPQLQGYSGYDVMILLFYYVFLWFNNCMILHYDVCIPLFLLEVKLEYGASK